jgi:DNA-binding transcriptional LysR family regulator
MELRHVRYFVAVAEHGHFGRAAEALHTAQPSLSQQVRQLEREIGVPLFERTTRRLKLTPAGELFLAESRQILAAVTASVERTRSVAKGERGRLRITFVSGAMGAGALPQMVHDFRDAYPDVALTVEPMTALAQAEALREGTVHIGFFSGGYRDDEFEQTIVWRERFIVAVPSGHPFAKSSRLHFDDLHGERVVVFSRTSGSMLQDAAVATLHEFGIVANVVHQGGDAETIIGLVAAGGGMSLVPQSWTAFQFPGVAYRRITPVRWLEPGMAMYRSRAATSPLIEAFVRSAEATMALNQTIQTLNVSIAH